MSVLACLFAFRRSILCICMSVISVSLRVCAGIGSVYAFMCMYVCMSLCVYVCMFSRHSIKRISKRVRIGLGFVCLFNGILTFVGYLKPKSSLKKNGNGAI